LITPSQMESTLLILKTDLEQRMTTLSDGPAIQGRTAVGLAHGLGVVVQNCPFRPLYYSASVLDEVWNLALSQLQLSGKSDLRISQVQIQVAWILIGSLMSSGTHFVKSHLNRLLLLWQNALPRPSSKDIMAGRPTVEIQYLLHLKERALAALNLLLHYNEKLITLDLSKRVMTMLADTGVFVSRIPPLFGSDDPRILSAQSQLNDTIHKVKAHIFRCYTSLSQFDRRNAAGSEILLTAISVFAESDSSLSRFATGKGTSNLSFGSLASAEDNFSWGVSGYVKRLTIPKSGSVDERRHWSIWNSDVDLLEDMVSAFGD